LIKLTEYDLGQVVGADGQDGVDGSDGSTIWYTSTAPSYANSKYTFTISNLTGKTGFSIAVSDLIFYDTYYYIVSAVNSTTVDCATRVSIKGSDASVTIVTSWNSTTSDSKVPSEKLSKTSLDGKLDKAQTSYKGKNVVVDSTTGNITFENKPTIPSKISDLTNDSDFIETSSTTGLVKNDGSIDTNSYITSSSLPTKTSELTNDGSSSSDSLVYVETSATSGLIKNDGSIDTTSYSTFSGSYSDLSNKPSIPSSSSDLSDGSDLVKKSNTTGLLKNDGTVDTSTYITSSALSGYQTTANLVTSFSSTTSDSKYPSEKLTKTELDKKITKSNSATGLLKDDGTVMTSGTGSSNWAVGNHTHSAYVNPTKVTSWSSTPSDSNVASEKLIKDSLDDKVSKSSTSGLLKNDGSVDTSSYLTTGTASSTYQTKLVSGTSIKTINNESLLGSGNITVGGGSSVDIVTAWESTPSDSKVASEKLVKDTFDDLEDLIGEAIQYINQ